MCHMIIACLCDILVPKDDELSAGHSVYATNVSKFGTQPHYFPELRTNQTTRTHAAM